VVPLRKALPWRREHNMAVTEEKRFNTETTALATRRDEHRVAAVACGAHALHDGR
jgi:hypothetical protein